MYPYLFIFATILFTYSYLLKRKHLKKYYDFYNKTATSPYGLPLLGNILEISSIKDLLGKAAYFYARYNKNKNCVCYIPQTTYITALPEECKIILNEAMEKGYVYEYLDIAVKNSLLVAPAENWKKNRKLFSRSFKQNILDSFVPTFNTKCSILMGKLRGKDYKDVCELFETYTLDIFCEATVGIKSSILADNDTHFTHCITRLQTILFHRISNVIHMSDYIFPFTANGRVATKYSERAHKFIQDVIKRKREHKAGDDGLDLNPIGMPVLDLLLEIQEKENLTDNYITKEMILFAGAATDTTAYTIGYTCFMLALNPDVQEKVYQEVITVSEGDRDIEAVDINKLKYTEMAINESMRILPVVPLVARKTTRDVDVGDKIIPRNTQIVLSFIHMHRDESIYPNPMKYDPDRFLPEEVKKRHPYSFLPFSGGPRNCIGFKYAQMVLKITIANIVKNFVISTSHKSLDDIEFESGVVMTPTTSMDLHFKPREKC